MKLLPIQPTLAENAQFLTVEAIEPGLQMTIDFFNQIGYNPPWIGYVVQLDNNLVGNAAFKGKPTDGRVEIAYGVFPQYQQRGIGTEIARQLTDLALQTDPTVTVTAQTLPEENFSTRILRKIGFVRTGTAWDDEEGEVWEWTYQKEL